MPYVTKYVPGKPPGPIGTSHNLSSELRHDADNLGAAKNVLGICFGRFRSQSALVSEPRQAMPTDLNAPKAFWVSLSGQSVHFITLFRELRHDADSTVSAENDLGTYLHRCCSQSASLSEPQYVLPTGLNVPKESSAPDFALISTNRHQF